MTIHDIRNNAIFAVFFLAVFALAWAVIGLLAVGWMGALWFGIGGGLITLFILLASPFLLEAHKRGDYY